MNTLKDNPYEPATVSTSSAGHRLSRWRILPTGFFLLLGLSVVGLAVFVIAIVSAEKETAPPIAMILLGASIWGLAGVLWIVASGCYWYGKYRPGTYIAILAFAAIALQSFFSG